MNSPKAFQKTFEDFGYPLEAFLQTLSRRGWKERDVNNVSKFIEDIWLNEKLNAATLNAIENALPEPMRAYYFHLRMLKDG
jgi:hypothetical protein